MNLIPGRKDYRLSFPDCFGLKNSSELEEAHQPCVKLGLSKCSFSYFAYMVFRVMRIHQYNQLYSNVILIWKTTSR